MRIIYSPYYDGDVFLGDSPKFLGDLYVGNIGLLQQLQLRIGIHKEAQSDVEREANYHNAMAKNVVGSIFENPFKVDPMGVASKLMQWRDKLIMAGWNGSCDNPEARKIKTLAKIEKDFRSPGMADCWKEVYDEYRKNGFCDLSCIESISVDSPWSELPYLIQQTLDAIKMNGVEVIEMVKEGGSAEKVDSKKIKVLEFEDVNDAYEWFATIKELPSNTAVINRDNVQLNHTLYTWNKPQVHSSLTDSNPQLLQLFKLCMSIFSRPLNIQNIVSYLMLPMSPIPSELRKKLAKLILSKGGFGEKEVRDDGKERDEWEEIIEKFEFVGKDGNNSPQAVGKAKAKKMPFLQPIRKDYSGGIKKKELSEYLTSLKQWAMGHNVDENLPSERRAQLVELISFLSSLGTALQALPDSFQYSDLEKLILQIYRPINYSLQPSEVGSSNVIKDVRSLAKGADMLVWLDCQEENIEHDSYDFLSSVEREYLNSNGCLIPDFAKHLKLCRTERIRKVNSCLSVILVRSKFNGTTRLGEHSLISEVNSCGAQIQMVNPDVFSLETHEYLKGDVEVLRPVLSLELGPIDYKGRKESNTSLDTLINFPFNYVVDYVAKLPSPGDEQINNPFITVGLVAHSFFEHVIKDSKGDLGEMRRLLNVEFDSRLESSIDATGLILRLRENAADLTEFKKHLKDSMTALIDIMEKMDWVPVGCEIEMPNGNDENKKPLLLDTVGDFGARIDFLLKTKSDGKYVIVDFKWSYSKSYEEKLRENSAIQLELYRQAVKATYPNKDVTGVGYYMMPKKQLFTTDFEPIPDSELIQTVKKVNDNDLFMQIQNSYKFRMDEISKGHIEEGETMDVSTDSDGYYANTDAKSLCPIKVDSKGVKLSEKVFRPSKKVSFPNQKLEPSEIATSHPILKGRLK